MEQVSVEHYVEFATQDSIGRVEHQVDMKTLDGIMESVSISTSFTISSNSTFISQEAIQEVSQVMKDSTREAMEEIEQALEHVNTKSDSISFDSLDSMLLSSPTSSAISSPTSIPASSSSSVEQSDILKQVIQETLEIVKEEIQETREILEVASSIIGGSEVEKILYVMRGVPGSGKSHLAKTILHHEHSSTNFNGVILSTDDFFDKEGIYVFNPKELPNAHQWNQKRALDHMTKGHSPIIIDNTNTQKWEAKFYVENGLDSGYRVIVREPETEWWKAKDSVQMAQKNSHGVPQDAIKKMLDRFEKDFDVNLILASQAPVFKQSGGGRGGRGRGRGGKN